MPDMISERDADIAYFGAAIADRHFLGAGPPPCIANGQHEWVNLPELAKELDAAFGSRGFHAQAFSRVPNAWECAECGKRTDMPMAR